MNNFSPLVSVILTVYNNKHEFILSAVKSIIRQSFKDFEIIIVDDGSNLEHHLKTKEILNAINYNFVYLYTKNDGVSSARNKGLCKARGKYICFLDPDDLYTKNKLAVQYNIFKLQPELDVVCGASLTKYCYLSSHSIVKEFRRPIEIRGVVFPQILDNFFNVHGTPNYMFKKQSLMDINSYDESLLLNEDRDLLYRLSKNGLFYTHNDIVCIVHKNEFSTSNNMDLKKLKSKLKFFYKIVQDSDIGEKSEIKLKYRLKYFILKIKTSNNHRDYLEGEIKSNLPKLSMKIISKPLLFLKIVAIKLVFTRLGWIFYYMLKHRMWRYL